MENPSPNRWPSFFPALLFLAAFGFSLIGLNPTFYLNDSPETAVAFALLGIPHPPGYPLHTLAGHLFTLLPLGSLSFRANLFSAALSAAVAGILFLFLRDKFKVSSFFSALFALLWITGATVYPASLSAKTGIYLLTVLLLIGILGAFWDGRWALAFFLTGLSLANHWMTMVVLIPGLLLLAVLKWRKDRTESVDHSSERERVELLLIPSFLILGLSLYLYLPLRAHLNPWLNWGDPSTWSRFLESFLRREYGGTEAAGGPGVWLVQGWVFLQASFREFGGMFLVALLAWAGMVRSQKDWAWGLGLCWLSLFLAVSLYLNLPQEQLYLIQDYALASHLFILLTAAWGLDRLIRENEGKGRSWAGALAAGALVLLFILPGLARAWDRRQTEYTYSYDYVLNGFKALPRNALYFCKGDSVVFPCWYFQWVEGIRKDLAVVGVDGFPMEWIRRNLALAHPGLKVPVTNHPVGVESIPLLTQWVVDHNKDRELYFSYNKIEDGTLPGTRMALYGVTGKGFAPGTPVTLEEDKALYLWERMRLRHLGDLGFPVDARTRENVVRDYGVFRNSLGIYDEDRADEETADSKKKGQAKLFLEAQAYYQKSYDQYLWSENWAPENPQYAFNTGNALFHLGKVAESENWYQKAVELDGKFTKAYFNWAVAAMQLRNYQKSGDLLEKVLELKPNYTEARTGLDYLLRNKVYEEK